MDFSGVMWPLWKIYEPQLKHKQKCYATVHVVNLFDAKIHKLKTSQKNLKAIIIIVLVVDWFDCDIIGI